MTAIAVLGSLIALASSGRSGLVDGRGAGLGPALATATPAPEPTSLVAVRPPAIGRAEGAIGVAPVTLRVPASADAVITGTTVTIDGELAVHASSLRIALEIDRLHHLGAITIDTTDPNGELRPDRTPTFHVELSLPSPRPAGRLWVVITAYDGIGRAIGTLRESVEIGARLPD